LGVGARVEGGGGLQRKIFSEGSSLSARERESESEKERAGERARARE